MNHVFLKSCLAILIGCSLWNMEAQQTQKPNPEQKRRLTVMAPGKQNFKRLQLPTHWKLFRSDDITADDASSARFEDDTMITAGKKESVSATVLPAAPLLNLAPAGWKHSGKDRAVLAGVIVSEIPQTIYVGMGADWWIDGFCNGKYFGGTDVGGNDNWPPSASARVFALKLRAGRNDISFLVKSGSGSWAAAIDFYSSCNDPDIPPRRLPEPGIAFAPYLTNPSADSVTINYLLNGRQPLELEYRLAGTEKWTKVSVLRGGQILDETPVLSFQLKGLKPDSLYEYRALRRLPPTYKTAKPEEIRTFRTYSGKKQNYSFLLMGDTQDTTKRKNLERVRMVFRAFPEVKNSRFFVHVGDFHGVINHFRNDVFDSVLKAIPSEMYIVSARGNHEFEGAEAQQWLDHFAYENKKSYGMFRVGEVCYLVLDTGHHLSAGSKNVPIVHSYLNQLDTLLEEQTLWLREVVKTPEYQTAKFRIVFAHVSPFGQIDSFRHMVPRSFKIVEKVFKKKEYRPDLWVAGHTHGYKRLPTSPEWGFPMVVVGGGGPNAEKRPGLALYFKVQPGKITMEALNADGTIEDTFILKK